jgi:hypothetical protein
VLLVVTLCAVGRSWLAVRTREKEREREAVTIKKVSGFVWYDYQDDGTGNPDWKKGPVVEVKAPIAGRRGSKLPLVHDFDSVQHAAIHHQAMCMEHCSKSLVAHRRIRRGVIQGITEGTSR